MNKAFTLIELLVVVLIIGILSAVALPQYQKAVMKARYIQLKVLAHSIADAQEVYYMANGSYATKFEDLDVQLPTPTDPDQLGSLRNYSWGSCALSNTSEKKVICTNTKIGLAYDLYYTHSDYLAGGRLCVARNSDINSLQNQLCKGETGKSNYFTQSTGAFMTWLY